MTGSDDLRNIGDGTWPTGKLRLRHITPITCRLEQQWEGHYGTMWLEVPHVDVNGNQISISRDAPGDERTMT